MQATRLLLLEELEPYGADDAFIEQQLRERVTLQQARHNFMLEMNRQLQALDSRAELAKAKAQPRAGVTALTTRHRPSRTGGHASAFNDGSEFSELVNELVESKGCSRGRAISLAARANPEAHQEFIEAANLAR